MIYFFWYYVFQIALKVEHTAIVIRDKAQRKKMNLIPPVPGYWLETGGW